MNLNQKQARRLKTKYGQWVLITGATSGIGRELALQFAQAGFSIVINGRQPETLSKLAETLFERYQTEVLPVAADLSTLDGVNNLIRETESVSLGIVILNAGFGTSGRFIENSIKNELNMLGLNVQSVLVLAHHFGREMAKNRRGALVLLSSVVAFQGVPFAVHYAATKAYVQSLGEGLAEELKPLGVDVLCAAPGPVNTGFFERARMQMGLSMQVADVAVAIIQAIGRQQTVFPGLLSKLMVYSLRTAPRWAKVKIMGKVMAGFVKHQHA